ncbi:hypothetical protein [Maritimibacter sp. DP1N21-5]|uniref:hypothetical protein n=1 Tax=Maritimibacter sp. DP1N21-5 TaxID=2836867 RepID=UPI001C443D21|nr:hypothetical protein [Maritimibacter sp. DP1N21-5]MBV7408398.1 hypothetical protein [Maritimibacter sp. DP1N21-5]
MSRFTRLSLVVPLAFSGIGSAAFADACEDEIRALYGAPDGVMDPSNLVPQEHQVVWEYPDGTKVFYNTARWESPARVLNETPNGFYLLFDGSFYQGASWEGPWEPMGQDIDYDPVDFARGLNASVQASLRDVRCDGTVDLDGREALRFGFFARVEPPGGGSWWEATHVLYVDPVTKQRLRIEEHRLSESWAPEVKEETRVTTVTLLPGYTIPNPPGPE